MQQHDQKGDGRSTGSVATREPEVDSPTWCEGKAGGRISDDEMQLAMKSAKVPLFLVFLVVGVIQLAGWNAMLNGLPGMIDIVFKVDDYASTVTATFCTSILFITLPFLVRKWVTHAGLHIGMQLSALTAIAFGLTCQLCENASTAEVLFHIYGAFFSLSCALIANNGFGLAAEFPGMFGGAVSTGMGVSGILTFIVWMIATYGIFDPNEPSGVRGAIWTLCGVLTVISPVASLILVWLYRRDDVKLLLEYKKQQEADAEAGDMYETYDEEGLWALYKHCWVPCVALLMVLGVTLAICPSLAPLSWKNLSGLQRDIIMGVYQVFDCLGRYSPNLIPALVIPGVWKLHVANMRLIFLVLTWVTAYFSLKAFWGSFGWQFVLQMCMSGTGGWINSLTFMTVCDDVRGNKSQQKAMSFALLHSYIGLTVGQWVGYGLAKAL